MPTHKYLIAVRYDQYESTFYTYYSRKEALAKYAEEVKAANGEVWFCNIPKQPEVIK